MADRRANPHAVICPEHGRVFLTEHQYIVQMMEEREPWRCPICATPARWDDANYDAALLSVGLPLSAFPWRNKGDFMNHHHYVLEGHLPVPEPDPVKWRAFFRDIRNRRVKQDYVGIIRISTVFVGLDLSGGREPNSPWLFETEASTERGVCQKLARRRCSTWAQALAQHEAACIEAEHWLAGRGMPYTRHEAAE